ncbi:hypothetical protein GCM10027610_068580 [Dactylosporangium cerinum]
MPAALARRPRHAPRHRIHQRPHSPARSHPVVLRRGKQRGSGKRVEAGRFEVWICAACGYTEWYAHEVNEALAWLTQNPHSGVRYYDADAVARPASAG